MIYQPSKDRYDTMKYNRCGKSGIKLPAISLETLCVSIKNFIAKALNGKMAE